MKRLIIGLMAVLCLAGCTSQVQETTAPVTTEPSAAERYKAESQIEEDTNGAVRTYTLESKGYFGLANLGSKLLIFGTGGHMDAFSGEEMTLLASSIAGDRVGYDTPSVSVTTLGAAYYRDDTHDVVLLNPMLSRADCIALPEDAEGEPAISLDRGEIYYCAGQEIRALDMQTGISRVVRTHSCESQVITGIYFEGRILSCVLTDQDGLQHTLYISTETGQTVTSDRNIGTLVTFGSRYFLTRTDNLTPQLIYGELEGDPRQLHLEGTVLPLPEINAALQWSCDEGKLAMSLYDLGSGLYTGQVTISGVSEALCFVGSPESGKVWILAKDGQGQVRLHLWDPKLTPTGDETVYTTPLYTADAPDETGLAACRQRAEALSDQYGVTITLWQDALSETGEYAMTAEYQVDAITDALDQLEATLAIFPEDVFTESLLRGDIHIALVRSIEDDLQAVHFWKNKDAYVSIAVGPNVAGELVRHMAYAIDSHTAAYSKNYDLWNDLNPEGFSYELGYKLTGDRADNTYLEGEKKAFVDSVSMSYPVEDRCAIFFEACQAENEVLFEAPYLQTKLRTICLSIREAYALEKHPEPFLWEQYLKEPLV